MKAHPSIAVAAMAGLLAFVSAALADKKEPPNAAQHGTLKASLVLTDKGQDLFRTWQSNPEYFEVPGLREDRARRGLFLTAIILFSGCAADNNGMCNATVTYTAYDPKGAVYGDLKDGELWVGKAALEPELSQLSVAYLGLVIEPKDPPGQYRVRATIKDHVANISVDVSRSFTVDPVPPTPPPTTTKPEEIGSLAGFWKENCDQSFGLRIAEISSGLYSVSFCGPGGCAEPGSYRPNSAIFGDDAYRVFDKNTIGVLGRDGEYARYRRCDEVTTPNP